MATQDNKQKAEASDSDSEQVKPPRKKVKTDQGAAPVASIFTKKPSGAGTSKASEEKEPEKETAAAGESTEDESEFSSDDDDAAAQLAEVVVKKKANMIDITELGDAPVWKDGEPVPYAALVHTWQLIESTTKRLAIASYLTTFLISVIQRTPDDLLKVIYLCINRICPDYEGLELGIGESILIKAISQATGRKPDQIKADLKAVGDLGTIAQSSRAKQPGLSFSKPKPLTVAATFKQLKQIAQVKGGGSQAQKVGYINKLLAACQNMEAKFIIRSLEGKLRIGLAEKSVLVSLAHAVATAALDKEGKKKKSKEDMTKILEEAANVVKGVYSELPNYDLVVPALLKHGIDGVATVCKLTPGIPLKPMLAKPTKAITEVLDRFEGKKFTCEYKYDGERAQVHYLENGSIKVFSRNSEDMSVKYPDLVVQLPNCIKKEVTRSFVLDCEVVAWDIAEKRMLPFQDLSRRKRKDVRVEDITVKVHLFAFDLLYLNGESLLRQDLEERRKLLRDHFTPVANEFSFASWSDADTVDEIQVFLDASIKDGCEGLMVKMLQGQEAHYLPSQRSTNWLKVKKDYLAGSGDSFDLVVIGGYFGKGKRTQWYGAFLLACYDSESETYQAVCKLGTGFSEEQLGTFHAQLQPLELGTKRGYYEVGTASPDVYFEPRYVWEVLSADLSLSPVYTAGRAQVGGDRGISLRFPRLIRIRDDKSPEDATDAEQIAEAYQKQAIVVAGKGKKTKGANAEDAFW